MIAMEELQSEACPTFIFARKFFVVYTKSRYEYIRDLLTENEQRCSYPAYIIPTLLPLLVYNDCPLLFVCPDPTSKPVHCISFRIKNVPTVPSKENSQNWCSVYTKGCFCFIVVFGEVAFTIVLMKSPCRFPLLKIYSSREIGPCMPGRITNFHAPIVQKLNRDP
ncbi:hypothetical protein EYC84_002503 [Monilinia fructicola]|uniref:Uncharacterized protein n=1 Tax=Monilinia fructicola TaxID=38448 RepID=A0A5M9JQ81_MONFR|nr:hypothetical protein EYC84_002503 [Monilinia fructicola]